VLAIKVSALKVSALISCVFTLTRPVNKKSAAVSIESSLKLSTVKVSLEVSLECCLRVA
jgi:hypothetical protein